MIKIPSGPWWPVLVYLPESNTCLGYDDALIWTDAIRGNNPLEALKNAIWNWPAAEWVDIDWHSGLALHMGGV